MVMLIVEQVRFLSAMTMMDGLSWEPHLEKLPVLPQ